MISQYKLKNSAKTYDLGFESCGFQCNFIWKFAYLFNLFQVAIYFLFFFDIMEAGVFYLIDFIATGGNGNVKIKSCTYR